MTRTRGLSTGMRKLADTTRSRLAIALSGPSSDVFANIENEHRYAYTLPTDPPIPGVSAMLRAKNEATNVKVVLPEILGLFDEVVFVDNASTDDTVLEVARIAATHPEGHRLRIASYPFRVSRCGDEHWATPENSVHNLAYFYNWCLSQCSFAYVFKWDLDMVPIPGRATALRNAFDSIDHGASELWTVSCQTIYKAPDGRWFAARDEVNREPRLHPNRASVRYRKARMWEALTPDIELVDREVPEPSIYELKDTTVDEFDHWTSTDDLSPRKRIEYTNYCAVRSGDITSGRFTPLIATELPAGLQ